MKELRVCLFFFLFKLCSGVILYQDNFMYVIVKDGFRTFNDFLREGLIEYLDVNEQNNALVCT